jgi:hypothetical protein
MWFLLRALFGVGLATTAVASPASVTPAPEVHAILSEPLPDDAYAERRSCIGQHQMRSTEILDTRRILFHGANGRIWLNQLRQACYGLERDRTLAFEIKGSQLCRMDHFRAIERMGGRPMNVGGDCFLGDFELVTEAQAGLLREAAARKGRLVPATVAGEEQR